MKRDVGLVLALALLCTLLACKRNESAAATSSAAPAVGASAAPEVAGGNVKKYDGVGQLTEMEVTKGILAANFHEKAWRIADTKKVASGVQYRIENVVEGKGKVAATVLFSEAQDAPDAQRLAKKLTAGKSADVASALYGGRNVIMVEVLDGLDFLKDVTTLSAVQTPYPAENMAWCIWQQSHMGP